MNILDVALPQVQNHNEVIRAVNNHVFTMGETDFFLRYAQKKASSWVKVQFVHQGAPHEVFVSSDWVDAFLAPQALSLQGMSADAITLWLLTLTPSMPKNLYIKQLEMVSDVDALWVLEAYSYASNTSLGWQLASQGDLPVRDIVKVLTQYCKGVMTSPMAKLPIALPLIACAISFPASEISGLEVGDVILLEDA